LEVIRLGEKAKIANSRLGPMRFAKHEGNPNSEVKVSYLSPEEIKERFGKTPAAEILTKEKFMEMTKQGLNLRDIARELKLHYESVKSLSSKYFRESEKGAFIKTEAPKEMDLPKKETTKEEKTVVEEAAVRDLEVKESRDNKISHEEYQKLKKDGLSNQQISEEWGIHEGTLYNYLKKWRAGKATEAKRKTKLGKSKPVTEMVQEVLTKSAIQQKGNFEKLGSEIGKLVDDKQQAYGDSFSKCGQFLQLLYPNGIQPDQYTDALAQVRIFDKQMRIATNKNAFGESPYKDIAGYGLLGAMKDGSLGG
jgi:DNA-binding CsgD family transcriptional regulator